MKTQRGLRKISSLNTGSALITVIIAMLFVIALGSALLYMAYVGYSVSIAERGEAGGFYSADSEMNKIVTGIQGLVSESLIPAYTETLTDYAKGTVTDPQKVLSGKLTDRLCRLTSPANGLSSPLLSENGGNFSYSVSALASFLDGISSKINDDGSVTVSLANGGTALLKGSEKVEKSIDENGFGCLRLKGINLIFTSADGYETSISSDIKINIPDFFSAASSSADAGGYALIAEKGISRSSGGKSVITGNIFAGGNGIVVDGNGNGLVFKSGNVCAKGGIKAVNGANFDFSAPDNELWTDEIRLGSGETGASAKFDGKVYVSGDLIFAGKNSSAVLKGEYFGFGSAADGKGSAILVNAQKSKLDISQLDRMTLAGVSYIDISGAGLTSGGNSYSAPIIMGQSLATKADQLAYLLPPECLLNYFANPCVLKESDSNPNELAAPLWDENAVLWKINGSDRTLKYYLGTGGEKGKVIPLYSSGSGGNSDKIAYIFIVFKDRGAASEYFKDYFAAYPQSIEQYADLYLSDLSGNAKNVIASGSTFYNSEGDKLCLYVSDKTVLTGNLSTRYRNKISPLDKYAYREKVYALGNSSLSFEKDGKEVAVVSGKDYVFTGANNDLKLIVSAGDVTLNGSFSGMVIAGGTVNIRGTGANIQSLPLDSDLLSAKSGDFRLSDFVHSLSGAGEKNAWDLNELVVCDNWKKN